MKCIYWLKECVYCVRVCNFEIVYYSTSLTVWYICVFVYACVHPWVCLCVYASLCTHALLHACMHVIVYICLQVIVHLHICHSTSLSTSTYVHTSDSIYVYGTYRYTIDNMCVHIFHFILLTLDHCVETVEEKVLESNACEKNCPKLCWEPQYQHTSSTSQWPSKGYQVSKRRILLWYLMLCTTVQYSCTATINIGCLWQNRGFHLLMSQIKVTI